MRGFLVGLLNNPWFIGIGGGIVSGFLVAWITHIFLGRGENKEYMQKIASANRDVIYAIRPGISEGQIPTKEVISALVHATARRHSITPSDMYGPHELAEELIKEVMDSSFLSSVRKAEYCHELTPLQSPPAPTGAQMDLKSSEDVASLALADYRQRTRQWISILLGVLTSTISILMAFIAEVKDKQIHTPEESTKAQVFLLGLTMATVLGTAFGVYILSRSRNQRQVIEVKESIIKMGKIKRAQEESDDPVTKHRDPPT